MCSTEEKLQLLTYLLEALLFIKPLINYWYVSLTISCSQGRESREVIWPLGSSSFAFHSPLPWSTHRHFCGFQCILHFCQNLFPSSSVSNFPSAQYSLTEGQTARSHSLDDKGKEASLGLEWLSPMLKWIFLLDLSTVFLWAHLLNWPWVRYKNKE